MRGSIGSPSARRSQKGFVMSVRGDLLPNVQNYFSIGRVNGGSFVPRSSAPVAVVINPPQAYAPQSDFSLII